MVSSQLLIMISIRAGKDLRELIQLYLLLCSQCQGHTAFKRPTLDLKPDLLIPCPKPLFAPHGLLVSSED